MNIFKNPAIIGLIILFVIVVIWIFLDIRRRSETSDSINQVKDNLASTIHTLGSLGPKINAIDLHHNEIIQIKEKYENLEEEYHRLERKNHTLVKKLNLLVEKLEENDISVDLNFKDKSRRKKKVVLSSSESSDESSSSESEESVKPKKKKKRSKKNKKESASLSQEDDQDPRSRRKSLK